MAPDVSEIPANTARSRLSDEDSHYEFDQDENLKLRTIARWTGAWGIVSLCIGAGVGIVALGLTTLLVTLNKQLLTEDLHEPAGGLSRMLVLAGVQVAMGILYIAASMSMRDAAFRTHNDMRVLMRAVARLTWAFRIETVLFVVMFALNLFAFLVGVEGSDAK